MQQSFQAISNAKIVTGSRVFMGTIFFLDGKISDIKEGSHVTPNSFDAQGKYLLPGLIETHGHFREPGLEHKEDIPHGTRAALAGGFTTVFDMPNTKPPTTTVDLLHKQIERYSQKSFCDFAINFGSAVEDIDQLEKVAPTEITGVKVFMAGHQTTPTTITVRKDQERIWEIAARRGFPVMVHAEDQALVTKQESELQKAGRTDMLAYSEARNHKVVEKAAKDAVEIAIKYGTKLWILHASTRGEFESINFGRSKGIDTGGEVTGYQLFFTTDDYDKLGSLLKVSPAIRSPHVNKELWEMVRAGVIDGFCSEHTPHALEEKKGDIWQAVSGAPGVQESVSAFITGWIRVFGHDILEEGFMRLSQMGCTNVANFFGFPHKSGIKIGNDADVCIIDVAHPWKVKKSDLFTKLQWSVYEGLEFTGRPFATFRRGELMYYDGKIVSETKGVHLKTTRK